MLQDIYVCRGHRYVEIVGYLADASVPRRYRVFGEGALDRLYLRGRAQYWARVDCYMVDVQPMSMKLWYAAPHDI